MNELIQALLLQSKNPNTGMVEEEKFAELIVQECINCYSPDDSATDWADKMRRMIEP